MVQFNKFATFVSAAAFGVLVPLGASAWAQGAAPVPGNGEEIPNVSSPILTKTQFHNLSFTIWRRIDWFAGGGRAGGTQTSSRSGGASGANAGDGSLANGLWGNLSYNRYVDSDSNLAVDGGTYTGIVAYDHLFWDDRLLVGVGVVIDSSDFSTLYNGGDLDSRSYGVVPYVAWRATDALTASLLFNYSSGSADTTRISGSGPIVTGDYDFDRWFVEGGLDYEITRGKWSFIAQTWLSYGEMGNDGFTESNGTVVGSNTNVLGTWRIGGQIGHTFTLDEKGGGFAEPYFTFGYEIDFEQTKIRAPGAITPHANDNDQFNIGGGVNVYVGDNWSANIEGMGALGRTNIDNWTMSGTLRYQF